MNFLVDYFPCNLRSSSFKLRYIPTCQIHNLLGHLTENNLFVILSVFSIHSNFTQSTYIVFTQSNMKYTLYILFLFSLTTDLVRFFYLIVLNNA